MGAGDPLYSLAADLRKAGPDVGKKARLVVKTTALKVVRSAQLKAPVDTGATKNSISATFGGNAYVSTAVIGPTTHYAPYLEFGTARMSPRPFMGPALDQHTETFTQAMTQLGGEIL